MMIKGVNKRILEVSLPDSEHFEKAVIFLRADCSPGDEYKAAAEARARIIAIENGLCGGVSPARARARFILRKAISAAFRLSVMICAAAAVFIIAHILR